jgi:repressor LexA
MVIALLGGENATLKKFYRESGGTIRLQPANSTMKPIYVDEEDVRVRGVVIGVLRKY